MYIANWQVIVTFKIEKILLQIKIKIDVIFSFPVE